MKREIHVGHVEEIQDHIDFVKLQRGVEGKLCSTRVALDNGGGFYKIGINVLDQTLDREHKPFFGKDFKDTSVKKLNLIGICQEIKENDHNVRKTYEVAQISKLEGTPHTLTGDQKMVNLLVGKSNHASKCPCGYCNVETPFDLEEDGDLNTLGYLREQNREYVFAGSPSLRQREFDNVVNWPILHGPDDLVVLDRVPLSVLHLKLRCVNHICDDLTKKTKKRFKKDLVLEFAKEHSIVRKDYHGGSYQGNQCSSIMKKVDFLEAKLPENLKPYTRCLRTYGALYEKCHGMKVEPGYERYLEDFKVRLFLANQRPALVSSDQSEASKLITHVL